MPQATDELRNEWQDENGHVTDVVAMKYLMERGFTFDRGGIIHPPEGYTLDKKVESAIDFMCNEWDYAYAGVKK